MINREDTDEECRRGHLDSPEKQCATKLVRAPTKEQRSAQCHYQLSVTISRP